MKKHNFYLSDEETAGLKALKKKKGITEAEIVRRAIDEYLKRELK
jgi:predicted DNA-binding protein